MHIGLWIANKKYEFHFSMGWYRGSEFVLFDFSILDLSVSGSIPLLQIHIAKFEIYFSLERKD